MILLAVESLDVALPYPAVNAASGVGFTIEVVRIDGLELAVRVGVRRARHIGVNRGEYLLDASSKGNRPEGDSADGVEDRNELR